MSTDEDAILKGQITERSNVFLPLKRNGSQLESRVPPEVIKAITILDPTEKQKSYGLHQDLRGSCSYFLRTEDEEVLRLGTFPIEEGDFVVKFLPDFDRKFLFSDVSCVKIGPLFPFSTDGDGNCLLHAISLSLWGMHDRELPIYIPETDSFTTVCPLRHALSLYMNDPSNTPLLRLYFKAAERRFNALLSVSSELRVDTEDDDMERDFIRELEDPKTPGKYLTAFHIYCVANMLRRPIIVYGDPPSGDNRMRGVYLPTMLEPDQTYPFPLTILFTKTGYSGHFTAVLSVDTQNCDPDEESQFYVPLCDATGEVLSIPYGWMEENSVEHHRAIELGLLPKTDLTILSPDELSKREKNSSGGGGSSRLKVDTVYKYLRYDFAHNGDGDRNFAYATKVPEHDSRERLLGANWRQHKAVWLQRSLAMANEQLEESIRAKETGGIGYTDWQNDFEFEQQQKFFQESTPKQTPRQAPPSPSVISSPSSSLLAPTIATAPGRHSGTTSSSSAAGQQQSSSSSSSLNRKLSNTTIAIATTTSNVIDDDINFIANLNDAPPFSIADNDIIKSHTQAQLLSSSSSSFKTTTHSTSADTPTTSTDTSKRRGSSSSSSSNNLADSSHLSPNPNPSRNPNVGTSSSTAIDLTAYSPPTPHHRRPSGATVVLDGIASPLGGSNNSDRQLLQQQHRSTGTPSSSSSSSSSTGAGSRRTPSGSPTTKLLPGVAAGTADTDPRGPTQTQAVTPLRDPVVKKNSYSNLVLEYTSLPKNVDGTNRGGGTPRTPPFHPQSDGEIPRNGHDNSNSNHSGNNHSRSSSSSSSGRRHSRSETATNTAATTAGNGLQLNMPHAGDDDHSSSPRGGGSHGSGSGKDRLPSILLTSRSVPVVGLTAAAAATASDTPSAAVAAVVLQQGNGGNSGSNNGSGDNHDASPAVAARANAAATSSSSPYTGASYTTGVFSTPPSKSGAGEPGGASASSSAATPKPTNANITTSSSGGGLGSGFSSFFGFRTSSSSTGSGGSSQKPSPRGR